jgi:hypothetical protein
LAAPPDLLIGGRFAEAHWIFFGIGQSVDPAGMDLRRVGACEQRHYRKRLAGIDRAEHDAHLLSARELGGAVHGLGRVAWVSRVMSSICRPSMPPAALISCTASWIPRLMPTQSTMRDP